MPKLLQINVTANCGSTGRIAEDIGRLAIDDGWESWIAFGRGEPESKSHLIRIGNDWDMKFHGIQTRIFDKHGLASKHVTKKFIEQIRDISPDIIHLHNIHGYYLNYPLLFDFLKEWGGPVVWTLHDCWPFTGHCAYYTYSHCNRWQTLCHDCPQLGSYPASWGRDSSNCNFSKKKKVFLGLKNLTLVPVSDWLSQELTKSFLKDYPIITIHNGIDLTVFTPTQVTSHDNTEKIILGVASVWDKRKGLEEFIKLRALLPSNYTIMLIGLSQSQISALPMGIKGFMRTESAHQLADLYSKVDLFVNPTLEDNFPTVNLEALACGTPVITYKTGGSPEALDNNTGIVVPYKDIEGMAEQIKYVCESSPFDPKQCRTRAEMHYDKYKVFKQYIELYHKLISQ